MDLASFYIGFLLDRDCIFMASIWSFLIAARAFRNDTAAANIIMHNHDQNWKIVCAVFVIVQLKLRILCA